MSRLTGNKLQRLRHPSSRLDSLFGARLPSKKLVSPDVGVSAPVTFIGPDHSVSIQQRRILLTAFHSPNTINSTLSRSTFLPPSSTITNTTLNSSLAGSHLIAIRLRHLPTLASTTQIRSHMGHSHHHHHDNTYLVSKNKKDPGVRITRIGLFVNLGMAAVKGAGGYFFNSQALMADAFHALTDLVSDFMTLATISWSWKAPTSKFPMGYGKVESLGSLGVSGLLLGGGVLMALNGGNTLYAQLFFDSATAAEHALHAHGHSHAAADLIPDIKAAWLAAGTIVIKEWLYRATMKVAKERKSSVLASNAVHHRVDSLTGLVAFIAVGGAHVLKGATWLDPVGSIIVSAMVIRAGWSNTGAALKELADAAVDHEMIDAVRKATVTTLADMKHGESSGEELTVREVQGLKSGQNYLMDIAIAAPNHWSMAQTESVDKAVREGVGSTVRGVRRVRIRFVPQDSAHPHLADEFIDPDINSKAISEPEKGHKE
ncbi:MAG: hypothetical protein M1816_007001 [Peltula sp. TS41687]|nr:MAG: hypothetical protein M1816_007001 [Peltula sp. TS41687]